MLIINKWGSTLNYSVFSSGESGGKPIEQGQVVNDKFVFFGLKEGLYNVTFVNAKDNGLTGFVTGPILEADSLVELKTISISHSPQK